MIKKLLNVVFILAFCTSIYGQETNDTAIKEKSNPIIYAEAFGGFSCMNHFGFAGGGEFNYQYKKSLFSFRYSHLTGYVKQDSVFAFNNAEDNDEYAILLGRRWLKNSHSFSISAGVSFNNLKLTTRDLEYNRSFQYKKYYGVPFEANFKWFKPKRKSNLILNVITPSFGLKVFGAISKNPFVGVGLTIGLGLNKEYVE